jgi:hypothetical protein
MWLRRERTGRSNRLSVSVPKRLKLEAGQLQLVRALVFRHVSSITSIKDGRVFNCRGGQKKVVHGGIDGVGVGVGVEERPAVVAVLWMTRHFEVVKKARKWKRVKRSEAQVRWSEMKWSPSEIRVKRLKRME